MKGRKCGTVESAGGVAGTSSKFIVDGTEGRRVEKEKEGERERGSPARPSEKGGTTGTAW